MLLCDKRIKTYLSLSYIHTILNNGICINNVGLKLIYNVNNYYELGDYLISQYTNSFFDHEKVIFDFIDYERLGEFISDSYYGFFTEKGFYYYL